MRDLFQVITLDENGLVGGAVFENPLSAVLLFSLYRDKLDITEAIFRKVGDTIVTVLDEDLTFALIYQRKDSSVVTFSSARSKEQLTQYILSVAKSPELLYQQYDKLVLVDLSNQKVVYTYLKEDGEPTLSTNEDDSSGILN